MKTILIIEDEVSIRERLISEARKVNNKIIIKVSDSEKEALKIASQNDIDAFFIDVNLVDSNGINLAKRLRKIQKYQFVPMVFITGIATKELEVYRQVHCYDYILKPFTDEEINKVFNGILGNYFSMLETKDRISLEYGECTRFVDADDIMYVEFSARKIKLMTIDGEINYKHISLKKFMKTLPKYFLQVHQAYAVNLRHVNYYSIIKGYIKVDHSDVDIPIGRSYRKLSSETLSTVGVTLHTNE